MSKKNKREIIKQLLQGKISLLSLAQKDLQMRIHARPLGNNHLIDGEPVTSQEYNEEFEKQLAENPEFNLNVKIIRQNQNL
jgi:DNA-directed RNA polymerase specialized sigma54-like protein